MRKAIVIALAIVLVVAAGALPAMSGPVNGAALPRADVQTDRDPGDPQVSNVPGPRSVTYSTTPAANNTYEYYETLAVAVEFSEAVSVTGAPYLELEIGSRVKKAFYHGGSGTTTLLFQYRVEKGDDDPDGVSVRRDAGINRNGGSINSLAHPSRAASTHFSYTVRDGSIVTTRLVILPVNHPHHKVEGVNSIPSFGSASVSEQRYTPDVAIPVLDLPGATGGDGRLIYGLNKGSDAPCGAVSGASGTAGASGASVVAIPRWMSYYAPGTIYNGVSVTGGGKIVPDVTNKPKDPMSACFKLYARDTDRDTSTGDRAELSFSVIVLADYDDDNDGLIDVDSLAKLNAIRWDLDGDGSVSSSDKSKYDAAFPNAVAGMGCLRDHDDDTATPKVAGCTGYELTRDLDFDKNNDGEIDAADYYWNGGKGWVPIGDAAKPFTATFNGDNKTISNLYINSTDGTADIGLFGVIGKCDATGNNCTDRGVIKNLGLIKAGVTRNHTSQGSVGSLAGRLRNGEVISCYATGSVSHTVLSTTASPSSTGGLIGNMGNSGKITASYAKTSVAGGATGTARSRVGGLVGRSSGTITASYATGSVRHTGGRGATGSLVGYHNDGYGGTITASYAIGAVRKGSKGGGLAGSGNGSATVTHSYWDAGTTGGGTTSNTTGANGKTTRELQSPTGYTGIYANWNVDLDGNGVNDDDPWDFGTNRQYPVLKYGGLDPTKQRQTSIQSDNWNAPVVGEPVVASLDVTGVAGITWQWQSSTNGSTWTDIANATSATYIPVTADVGKYLRAKVTFTASGKSRTLATVNTAKVVAAAATTATTTGPVVGVKIQYGISVTGAADHAWRWQRCDNAGMTTNCAYVAASTAATAEYTPVAGDVGKYLRAYAYYAANDAGKTWTRTETPILGPVVAAPAASP